jgi:NitT/TauT family transport system substrate-binding protein
MANHARTIAAALLIGTLAIARPASGVRAQTLQTIDVGVTGKTAGEWGMLVADALGFYKRFGVSPNFISVGSVAATAQQLAAGSLALGELSSTQDIEAIQGGAPIVWVLNTVITPPYSLMAKKEIRSLAQLKGKTIILGGVNDITLVFFNAMMKPTGLTPDDYILTYAGVTTERYAALKSGSVDAAMLFPPMNFVAESDGYVNIGDLEKVLPEFPFGGFAVNRAWAQTHGELLTAYLKGYLTAMRWLYDPANRVQAIQILIQGTGANPAIAA